MIRITIDRDEHGKRMFEIIYEAWIVGSYVHNQTVQPRTWDDMLIAKPFTNQLHKEGIPAPCGRKLATGDIAYTLELGGKQFDLVLDDNQYAFLLKYFKVTPWGMTVFDYVYAVWEFLNSKGESE